MNDGVGEVTETSDGGRVWRTTMEQHHCPLALAQFYWSSEIAESGQPHHCSRSHRWNMNQVRIENDFQEKIMIQSTNSSEIFVL